jgi:hypothetical protein
VVTWVNAFGPVSQAEIVPFCSAKMKRAEPPFPPCPTPKADGFPLETCPVGSCSPVPVVGIPTKPLGGLILNLRTFVPSVTVYRVAVLVSLFEIQKGPPVALCENPQGFCNPESVSWRARECPKPGLFGKSRRHWRLRRPCTMQRTPRR